MKTRLIEVKFEGTVEVSIPDHVSDHNADLLATKIALAKILATTENPDSPDLEACEEYLEEADYPPKGLFAKSVQPSEADWDNSSATVVTGTWEINK